jgi:hypothetical protein
MHPTHIYKKSGEYFVSLYTKNQCFEDSIKESVTVEIVGTKDFEAKEMLISPNPSSGNFSISFSENFMPKYIEIYDVLGNKVKSQYFGKSINDNQIFLDISDLPNNIYTLKISDGHKNIDRILLKIE